MISRWRGGPGGRALILAGRRVGGGWPVRQPLAPPFVQAVAGATATASMAATARLRAGTMSRFPAMKPAMHAGYA